MNIPGKYLVAGVVLLVVGLVGGAAIAFAASGAANNNANQAADVAQIQEVWNEYEASVVSGDFERWISLWDDEGIQLPPDEPRHIGIAQVRAANEPGFEGLETQMKEFIINPDEFRILGDRAYSHGTYGFTMVPEEGADTIEVTGKFLTIFKKQADGSWKIAIDCYNYSPLE
jgi:uncharacterized protein (TIGR02246 family)